MTERGQGASTVEVDRNGRLETLSVTPSYFERAVYDSNGALSLDSEGNPVTRLTPIIGVSLEPASEPMPLADSIGYGLEATGAMFVFILELPQQVYQVFLSTFGLGERDPYGAVSIVGVGQLAGELTAAEIPNSAKLSSLLLLLGSLNIALFAFNLIPLLPLDGGHVAGALYEGTKRKVSTVFTRKDPGPVDTAKALPVAYGMWVVLIFTGVVLIVADLINPITFG
jgi:membrane-associated protease RseP (regulator of RpoE activity)